MMNKNEIIKALECCINAENCCECVYTKMCDGTTIHQFALDLINRQKSQILKEQNKNSKLRNERNHLKAEIERLKGWQNLLKAEKHSLIKAEAIKEFAERLKKEMSFGRYIQYDQIDNLVKEMVGEG